MRRVQLFHAAAILGYPGLLYLGLQLADRYVPLHFDGSIWHAISAIHGLIGWLANYSAWFAPAAVVACVGIVAQQRAYRTWLWFFPLLTIGQALIMAFISEKYRYGILLGLSLHTCLVLVYCLLIRVVSQIWLEEKARASTADWNGKKWAGITAFGVLAPVALVLLMIRITTPKPEIPGCAYDVRTGQQLTICLDSSEALVPFDWTPHCQSLRGWLAFCSPL